MIFTFFKALRETKFLVLIPFVLFSCEEKNEEIKPTLGTMTESVYASVTVQPEGIYNVYASSAGILEKVFIEEGDYVKKGQTLAKISTNISQLNIENAMIGADYAKENYQGHKVLLTSIADEISTMKSQLQIDSLNYFRQKKLWSQNIGAQSELENRKLKYQLTTNNLKGLEKKYQQTELELENAFKQSQNSLKKAKANFKDFFILSKMEGRIYSLLKNEGELLNQQTPLATIGKSNEFLVEMLIDEVDITKIEIGQLALVNLDAYEGQVFEIEISRIYPQKDSRTQTFKVEGKFKSPPKKLYAGFSGEANIVLAEKNNVITIPLDYLLENDKVKTSDGEISLQLGMKNIERVEVVAGIDTSMIIQKP